MSRKELLVVISLAVLLAVINAVNYVRKENVKRSLTMVLEEGISPVSINHAAESELDDIPGIGPALAGRIVDYRRKNGLFKDVNDLKKVKGIGNKLFQEILAYVKL